MGNHSGHQGCVRQQSEDAEAELDAGIAIMHPPAFNRAEDAAKCGLLIDVIDLDILQLIDNLELCDQRYESLKGIILHAIFANELWWREGERVEEGSAARP